MLRALIVFALVLLAPGLALAQDYGAPVQVPVGDWAQVIIATSIAALGGAGGIAAFLLRKVPVHLRFLLQAIRVEQLLDRALVGAVNRIPGAAPGKTYDLDLGLKVANEMLREAIKAAPRLVREMGLEQMWAATLRRVVFDEKVAVPADARPTLGPDEIALLARR